MSRLLKVMVLLMMVSLASAVAVQPALATNLEVPVDNDQESSEGGSGGVEVIETYGEPGEGGEGDPDSVGGGYGATSGNNGLIGGLTGSDGPDLTLEQFIYLLLLQLMPSP